MNRIALRSAIRTTLSMTAMALAGGVTLWAAIWLPTLALLYFAGWSLRDAYNLGPAIGMLILLVGCVAVLSYRQKVRELRGDEI